MNKKTASIAAAAIALLTAGGYGLYQMGLQQGMRDHGAAPPPATRTAGAATVDPSTWTIPQGEEATRRHIRDGIKAGSIDPVTGRKVLHYQDPMVPGTKFDAPGKSPFMNMMLVPVYAGSEGADAGSITVSPRIQQNLGLRTAVVTEGRVAQKLTASGSISFNERDQVVVQARASAFVERLHARAALDRVARGQPLAELYVPDWVAAQEEFLALRRMQGEGLGPLREAAKARMRQAGMSDAQIAAVESSGRVQARITLTAPIAGVLTEVAAREGMAVMPGTTLFRINGLSTVWAQAEVPESQAALLKPNTKVRATSPAAPGELFEGKVQALLPEVASGTRTVKARMEIDNRRGQLVPGMFVQMQFTDGAARSSLLVPTEAVIYTGRRTVVMLAEDGGRFRPVEIETGVESGGQTEVKRGLAAGQKVVVSSQFLIDSEASLRGLESRLNAPAAPAPTAMHRTPAKVEALSRDTVTLTHPAIPALNWPAMTMDFQFAPGTQRPPGLQPGDQVDIEFRMEGGDARITSVRKLGSKP
jgi:Cu(I)/Ag(I) efflux system membrane fusion protein